MVTELFLGADVGGTGLKYVVVDGRGDIQFQGEVPTDPNSAANTLDRLRQATEAQRPQLAGVGLACAGIVDPVQGTLGRSPNLPGWENSKLTAAIEAAFDSLPTALVNDVNGGLYGEFKSGAGRGCENLVMIALGTGVGGGVLLNGELLVGSNFGAGEIGHTVLDPEGPYCTCGGRGCLEAWAGAIGFLRSARQAAAQPTATEAFRKLLADQGDRLTPRDLSTLALTDDATACALFDELGRRLGQAVGNLINILDPDRVLIGGGLAQAGDLFMARCRTQANSQILAEGAKSTPIVAAELGPHAAAVGAAWLAREAGRMA